MSNKIKIILGVALFSGLVFAASITKFYGDIDMQSHKITNLATPTANADGTTKAYVDTQIHTRLNKQGGQLTGTLDMQTNYIIRVKKPRSGSNGKMDATNRDYVDGATNNVRNYVNSTFLPLTGGTLYGNLTMASSSKISGLPISPDVDDTAATAQGLARYYWNDAKQAAKDYYTSATNYASGKLSLDGGSMYGDISMGGHRITAMPDPQNDFDGANKRYVDSAVNEGNAYQYFALKKGSGFTPFYALDSNTNRVFEVVICKDFTGAITSYYENIATTNSTRYDVNRHWNVGETIRVPFNLAAGTYSATNGTLIVKGGKGVVGNFGITAPPNAAIQYPVVAVIDSEEYNPETAVDISAVWDSLNSKATLKIKNNSGAEIPRLYINFGKATRYTSTTEYSAYASVVGYSSQTVPFTQVIAPLAAGAEKTIMLTVLPFDTLYGLRWSFEIVIGYTTFQFGQFFIPNVQ